MSAVNVSLRSACTFGLVYVCQQLGHQVCETIESGHTHFHVSVCRLQGDTYAHSCSLSSHQTVL